MTETITQPETGVTYLSSAEVVAVAGITRKQMEHWIGLGHLAPERPGSGSGIPRRWPPEEVRVARAMGRLVGAGLTVDMAAIVARNGWPRSQIGPGVWLELGPALSGPCGADDHGGCFPDEPSDCGCECHEVTA